jgi:hypothetical protein
MPDYTVEQELVQFGEGSLTLLEPRFWMVSGLPTIWEQFGQPPRRYGGQSDEGTTYR